MFGIYTPGQKPSKNMTLPKGIFYPFVGYEQFGLLGGDHFFGKLTAGYRW